MGVRIVGDSDLAALYDSVTMTAFGPVFTFPEPGGLLADESADAFLEWLPADARTFTSEELRGLYGEWLSERRRAAAVAEGEA